MDNERLIGDANKLSLSRFRKGGLEGDTVVSVFISAPARASGLSGGGGGGDEIVCLKKIGNFPYYSPSIDIAFLHFALHFNQPVIRVLLLCYPPPYVFCRLFLLNAFRT